MKAQKPLATTRPVTAEPAAAPKRLRGRPRKTEAQHPPRTGVADNAVLPSTPGRACARRKSAPGRAWLEPGLWQVVCTQGHLQGFAQALGDSPERLADYWRANIETAPWFSPDKEATVVFLLNAKLRIMGYFLIGIGTVSTCEVRVAEVLRGPIISGAYGFALAHNHPSGVTVPSCLDRHMTNKIKNAAALVEILFTDHVIIGIEKSKNPRSGYFSFAEVGLV